MSTDTRPTKQQTLCRVPRESEKKHTKENKNAD